jgi:hypothetical protein
MPSILQSIRFDKDIYTLSSSKKWLQKHNIKPPKEPAISYNYIRYRLIDPCGWCDYHTTNIDIGVSYIYMET